MSINARNAEDELLRDIERVVKRKTEQVERCAAQIEGNRWDDNGDGSMSLREFAGMLSDLGVLEPVGSDVLDLFIALQAHSRERANIVEVVQQAVEKLYGTLYTAEQMSAHEDLLYCRRSLTHCEDVAKAWDSNDDGSLSNVEVMSVLCNFKLLKASGQILWDSLSAAFTISPLSLPHGYALIDAVVPINSMMTSLTQDAFNLIKSVPGLLDKLSETGFSIIKAGVACVAFGPIMCGGALFDAAKSALENGGELWKYGKRLFELYNSCKSGPCHQMFERFMWDVVANVGCKTAVSGTAAAAADEDDDDDDDDPTLADWIGLVDHFCPVLSNSSGDRRRRLQTLDMPSNFTWELVLFDQSSELIDDLEGLLLRANRTFQWANETGGNLSTMPTGLFELPEQRAARYRAQTSELLGNLTGGAEAVAHAFTHSNLLRQRLNAASQLVERAHDLQTQEAQAQALANTTSDCAPSNASEQWLDGMLVRPTLALTRLNKEEKDMREQQQLTVAMLMQEAYRYARQIEFFTLKKSSLLQDVTDSGYTHLRVPDVQLANGEDWSRALGHEINPESSDGGFMARARAEIQTAAESKVGAAGEGKWVRHRITQQSSVSSFAQLHATGELDLILRPHHKSRYFDVRLRTARAFALPLAGAGQVLVEMFKGPDSMFMDEMGERWDFFHARPSVFESPYSPETCHRDYAQIRSSWSDSYAVAANTFDGSVNHFSPFGSWKLRLITPAGAVYGPSSITEVYLEFLVTYSSKSSSASAGSDLSNNLFEGAEQSGNDVVGDTLLPVSCQQLSPPSYPPTPSPPPPESPPSAPPPESPPSLPLPESPPPPPSYPPTPSPPPPESPPSSPPPESPPSLPLPESPPPPPPSLPSTGSPSQLLPLQATPTLVTVVLIASGDVGDYDESARAHLKARIASTAGVVASAITIDITAASVRIQISIAVASDEEAQAVNMILARELSNPQLATAFLADVTLAGGAVIRVEHVESIAMTKPLPSSQNAQQTTQDVLITSVLLWILIGIGVVVLLCLLAFTLACVRRRRRAKRSNNNVTVTRGVEVVSISDATAPTASVPVDPSSTPSISSPGASAPCSYQARLNRARMARSTSSAQHAPPRVEATSKASDIIGAKVSRI